MKYLTTYLVHDLWRQMDQVFGGFSPSIDLVNSYEDENFSPPVEAGF